MSEEEIIGGDSVSLNLNLADLASSEESTDLVETIQEKSYHLLRLLVANHPFVDANKRTALNTTVVFYFLNGYRFEYDDEIRTILKQFGTDEAAVDTEEAVEYLREHTEEWI